MHQTPCKTHNTTKQHTKPGLTTHSQTHRPQHTIIHHSYNVNPTTTHHNGATEWVHKPLYTQAHCSNRQATITHTPQQPPTTTHCINATQWACKPEHTAHSKPQAQHQTSWKPTTTQHYTLHCNTMGVQSHVLACHGCSNPQAATHSTTLAMAIQHNATTGLQAIGSTHACLNLPTTKCHRPRQLQTNYK